VSECVREAFFTLFLSSNKKLHGSIIYQDSSSTISQSLVVEISLKLDAVLDGESEIPRGRGERVEKQAPGL
jgi:hypothetical protein